MRHRRLVAALIACALSASVLAANTFSSLEERMSYKEFKEYGLDKLSPEQLRGLNEWLRTHGASTSVAAAAAQTANAGPANAAAAPDMISAHLIGEFRGWQKGTVLALDNGQRWEVRDDEPLYAHGEHNPVVKVERRGLVAGWTLTVEGYNDFAHVIPLDH